MFRGEIISGHSGGRHLNGAEAFNFVEEDDMSKDHPKRDEVVSMIDVAKSEVQRTNGLEFKKLNRWNIAFSTAFVLVFVAIVLSIFQTKKVDNSVKALRNTLNLDVVALTALSANETQDGNEFIEPFSGGNRLTVHGEELLKQEGYILAVIDEIYAKRPNTTPTSVPRIIFDNFEEKEINPREIANRHGIDLVTLASIIMAKACQDYYQCDMRYTSKL